MGVGVSLYPLARAVAKEGGVGIISSACLDRLVSKRTGKKHNTYDATYEEISLSKASGGFVGINIMVALVRDYVNSVRASIDAGADFIISGAGLPLSLPAIQPPRDTALIPIVFCSRTGTDLQKVGASRLQTGCGCSGGPACRRTSRI
jgi:nitronate monooxygenase